MKPIYKLLLSILMLLACGPMQPNSNDKIDTGSQTENELSWRTYTDSNYHFEIVIPHNWKVYTTPEESNLQVVNIYNPDVVDEKELPLNIHQHASISHLSLYPGGMGTELPAGQKRNLAHWKGSDSLNFSIDPGESVAFQLEDGSNWAYFIVPASPPPSWSEHGYLFAQMSIQDFDAKCWEEESGEWIPMVECDPFIGDSIVYSGQVISQSRSLIERSLHSFKFLKESE